MKVIQSVSLFVMGLFIANVTARYTVLTQDHYQKMIWAALIVAVLYFIPVVVISYLAYKDAGDSYF